MEMIQNVADLKEYHLPSHETNLISRAKKGWKATADAPEIDPIIIDEGDGITRFRPFESIYLRYEYEEEFQELYKCREGMTHPFTDDYKLDIIRRIITEPKEVGGLDFEFRRLNAEGKVLAFFPLHNTFDLNELKKSWFETMKHVLPWDSPYNRLKRYFGAKIALYFQFLGKLGSRAQSVAPAPSVIFGLFYFCQMLHFPHVPFLPILSRPCL